MLRTFQYDLRFLWWIVVQNLKSAMTYKMSFLIETFTTLINNGLFFVFWLLFFNKFQMVQGLELKDMFLLFSIVTTSFGIAFTFFSSSSQLASIISEGKLDAYFIWPTNMLLHLISSRFSVGALGDVGFGIVCLYLSGITNLKQFLLWCVVVLCAAVIFVAFQILIGSLVFWLGRSQSISDLSLMGIITFGTYPDKVFHPIVKWILYSLIPSVWIGSIPAEIVKFQDVTGICWLLIFTFGITCAAIGVFRIGRKRYESGNSINTMV